MLQLDRTTVKVTADGYATKSQALSACRTYPNLSNADVSLIPKTIGEKGKILTLADVEWASAYQTGAEEAVLRWSATASYTGSSSYKVATGYTVTADYTGEVAKTGCDMVTYTAIFGSTELPAKSPAAGTETETAAPVDLKLPLDIDGVVLVLGAGGVFLWKKKRGALNETAKPFAGRHAVHPLCQSRRRPRVQCGGPGGLPIRTAHLG